MPSEIIEPPLRTPHPDEPGHVAGEAGAPAPAAQSRASASPEEVYSDSNDELSAMLATTKPDPFLGTIEPEPVSEPPALPSKPEPEPAASAAAGEVQPPPSSGELTPFALSMSPEPVPSPEPPGSFDAVKVDPASVAPHRTEPGAVESSAPPVEAASPPAGAFDAISALEMAAAATPAEAAAPAAAHVDPLGTIDLSAPAPALSASKRAADEEEDDDDYDDDETAPRGPSLPVVLLGSYASAATLGLIWVVWILWGQRAALQKEEVDEPRVAEAKVDPGRRAGNSRRYNPPAPLAAERITTLGEAIRLRGVEATPLEVTSGSVRLKRSFTTDEERDGGTRALKLRLRLRNISKDSVFAPLDEAFIREREAGVFDSFIERGDGEVIDMFPLSVYSEWSIDGQEFKELKPGETLDTVVVSAAEAVDRKAPEMIWRVRLRTGINQTDVFGVQFKDSEIGRGR